jgi:ketosteroid isomerase-like protein
MKILRLIFLALILVTPMTARAATDNAAMQNENVDLVQGAFKNGMAGRMDLVKAFFGDAFVCHVAEGIPYGREFRGWQGYTELLGNIKTFWSDLRKDDTQFIPYGDDKVIIHFTLDGHIAKNGQHVRMPVVAIWRLQNKQVVEITIFYYDSKKVADLAAM